MESVCGCGCMPSLPHFRDVRTLIGPSKLCWVIELKGDGLRTGTGLTAKHMLQASNNAASLKGRGERYYQLMA